jgi:sugar/nucleoside kinase (ribokinase family)
MDITENFRPPVITIGSGNIEHVLDIHGELNLGRKHIAMNHSFLGGSCINYTLRLLETGESVYPIPLVGNDPSGKSIRDTLIRCMKKTSGNDRCLRFTESDDFFIPTLKTPETTIIVHQEQRTIFSERLTQTRDALVHIENRLQHLNDLVPEPGSLMIGHINTDCHRDYPGAVTLKTIDTFGSNHLMFANFGKGQTVHGVDFWKDALNRIDILQLNLDEIRKFFLNSGMNFSLNTIVDWLKRHSVTAVITLNRFGAIGTYGDGRNGTILSWPIEVDRIVDPTGAGDAFAAGMISSLAGRKNFSFDDFINAIDTGRYWAAYSCKSLGACAVCPDKPTIGRFIDERSDEENSSYIIISENDHHDQMMDLLDKAY